MYVLYFASHAKHSTTRGTVSRPYLYLTWHNGALWQAISLGKQLQSLSPNWVIGFYTYCTCTERLYHHTTD